jgi:hypothetical protein
VPAAALQLDHIIVGHDLTIRELTIQQYSAAEPRPNSASRNRRAMIEKVWAIWITGVLQPSLPHDILLDLGLTERPAMIARTLDLYAQRPDLADWVQAPGTQLVDSSIAWIVRGLSWAPRGPARRRYCWRWLETCCSEPRKIQRTRSPWSFHYHHGLSNSVHWPTG